VLCANLLARSGRVGERIARLREAFDGRALALPPSASGNVVVFGAAGATIDLAAAELRRAAARLRRDTGLALAGTIARLAGTRERLLL
jgi:spermidine synthase